MKKILLGTLVAATAACTGPTAPAETSGNDAPPALSVVAPRHVRAMLATSGAPAAAATEPRDDHDGGKAPRRRFVTPGSAGDAGAGGSSGGGGSSAWRPLTNEPPIAAGPAFVLTDGTVMVQDANASDWWKLTPDATGSYLNGTWTQLASLPGGYAPLYYASAVLPDGRLLVEGGEYDGANNDWSTNGAIYDPTRDAWTSVAPPAGWQYIGDAPSTVLADGRFLLSDGTSQTAIFDPATLTWTPFGSGKADYYSEEGWTLLPGGDLLTVDTNNLANLLAAEKMDAATGVWSTTGSTVSLLADITSTGHGSWEMGPQVLRPDGTVFAVGATGHTGIYATRTGTWTAGPNLPVLPDGRQLDAADGPAVLETNGHVMFVVSPGVFKPGSHVFDFDGTSIVELPAPPQAPYDPSFAVELLVLPSGEILFTDQSNDVEIYPAAAHADGCIAPRVARTCELGTLDLGKTYRLDGEGLNGVSQAVGYGDDVQAATNYPLVRITNRQSGHVVYARTHDHSSMSVDRDAASHTFFDVPTNVETGWSDLVVVANGIASSPVRVHIVAAR